MGLKRFFDWSRSTSKKWRSRLDCFGLFVSYLYVWRNLVLNVPQGGCRTKFQTSLPVYRFRRGAWGSWGFFTCILALQLRNIQTCGQILCCTFLALALTHFVQLGAQPCLFAHCCQNKDTNGASANVAPFKSVGSYSSDSCWKMLEMAPQTVPSTKERTAIELEKEELQEHSKGLSVFQWNNVQQQQQQQQQQEGAKGKIARNHKTPSFPDEHVGCPLKSGEIWGTSLNRPKAADFWEPVLWHDLVSKMLGQGSRVLQ